MYFNEGVYTLSYQHSTVQPTPSQLLLLATTISPVQPSMCVNAPLKSSYLKSQLVDGKLISPVHFSTVGWVLFNKSATLVYKGGLL